MTNRTKQRVPGVSQGPGHGGPASGMPAMGTSKRHPDFEPGNQLGLRHGAYALLALTPAATELADQLRGVVPVYDPADEPALQAFAMALVQSRTASAALEKASAEGGRGDLLKLSQDARSWLSTALKYSESFGMTPRSRVALGLDLVRGQKESMTLTKLAALADDEAEG